MFAATLSAAGAVDGDRHDAKGHGRRSGKGTGTKVAWRGSARGSGPFRWSIQAALGAAGDGDDRLRPVGPPVTLAGLAVTPVVTPDASGFGATAHVTFTLGAARDR